MSNGKTYNQAEIEELMQKSLEINMQMQAAQQAQQFQMGEVADLEMEEGELGAADEETEQAGFDESFMTLV